MDEPQSQIRHHIDSHRDVRVRKTEKATKPKHFYTGGGDAGLDPMAAKREPGPTLFNKNDTLKKVGK